MRRRRRFWECRFRFYSGDGFAVEGAVTRFLACEADGRVAAGGRGVTRFTTLEADFCSILGEGAETVQFSGGSGLRRVLGNLGS